MNSAASPEFSVPPVYGVLDYGAARGKGEPNTRSAQVQGARATRKRAAQTFVPHGPILDTLPATMPPRRPHPNVRALPPAAMVGPACLAAGLLFAGSPLPVVEALVVRTAATTAAFRGLRCSASHHRRSCVRPRGAGRLSLSAAGESGAEDMDSSELYADMRHRLEVRERGCAVYCGLLCAENAHLQAACHTIHVCWCCRLIPVFALRTA